MDVGGRLLLAYCEQGQGMEFLRSNLSEGMFYGSEVPIFQFVAAHVQQHAKLPHGDTLREQFPTIGKAPEPPSFYLDQVEERYRHKTLNKKLVEINALMKEQDSATAISELETTLYHLRQRSLTSSLIDFATTGADMVVEEIRKIKIEGEAPGIMLGWPTFDTMAGGVRDGDVVSVVGRPAMGKTWLVMFVAHVLWWLRSMPVLVVSMEMDLLSIAQRLMGITTGIETKLLRTAEITTLQATRLSKTVKKAKAHPVPLHLMDGSMHATVDQVFAVARQVKPRAVLIDGAYLMGHPDRRLNKFQRIDANVELIKQRAQQEKLPTILSYQLNREAVKKLKKKEEGGVEDIAYSDAIGQVSSAVLAMRQEDSVETAKQRLVEVWKCRSGQVGKFPVNWDFQHMNFTEVKQQKPGELQFT